MILRILLLLGLTVGTATGTAFAQLDVKVRLQSQRGAKQPIKDWKRLEHFDIVIDITNRSEKPVDLPANYSHSSVRLCASGSNATRWPLILFSRKPLKTIGGGMAAAPVEKKKTVKVAPRETHEVLRISAKEALISPGNTYAQKPQEEFATPKWVWEWTARPGADYSPFESRKGDRRTGTAVLWCELEFDGRKIRSVPLLVFLKGNEPG